MMMMMMMMMIDLCMSESGLNDLSLQQTVTSALNVIHFC